MVKDLHEQFRKEFQELLKKYNAEFAVNHHIRGYYTEDVPVIEFSAEFSDGKVTREYSEMKL